MEWAGRRNGAPAAGTAAKPASERGAGGMRLVMAIVGDEDAREVTEGLTRAGFRVTRLNTAGGFLRRGNATLLVGVEEAKLQDVFGILERTCRQRTEYMLPAVPEPLMGIALAAPVEVSVGGATVFVLNVRHFVRV